MTIRQILEEVNSQRPVQLDSTSSNGGFPDDHQFVVTLSAGLFRKVRNLCASFTELTTTVASAGTAVGEARNAHDVT